ncbi:MAG: beta-ketoacyl-ACP synthase 3, partial [Acidimicrobiales bacterium]
RRLRQSSRAGRGRSRTSTTPDKTVPATSSTVHAQLGCSGAAFDLNTACAGYVYATVVADAMLGAGIGFTKALVIGSETLSVITDMEDRATAVLFADGAAALVLEQREGAKPLILASDLGLDGSLLSLLYCDHGGYMKMEGREVFRRAVRVTVESALKVLHQAAVSADDIALFVPHQANQRIIDAMIQRLSIPEDRTAIVLDKTGNTSSASIPLALAAAADAGRLSDGDLILLSGFGAGMTWGSAILRWGQ